MKVFVNIIIFLLVFSNIAYSQNNEENTFLIITFERVFNKGNHSTQNYYWIIPADSIETKKSLSPFYFSGYSKTLFEKCKKNETVYPFDTFKDDEYDFDENYLSMQNSILSVIKIHRKKVLTIKKKFKKSKLKETILVYITAVKGEFCDCSIDSNSANRINYIGNIYLPTKNIEALPTYDISNLDIYKL